MAGLEAQVLERIEELEERGREREELLAALAPSMEELAGLEILPGHSSKPALLPIFVWQAQE